MSKIVDRTIFIPSGTNVTFDEKSRELNVKGSNGFFSMLVHPFVNLIIENSSLKTVPSEIGNDKVNKALTGTTNSLIFNAVKGSQEDYETILEFRGVGYKVSLKENELNISVGYSHDVKLILPVGIKINCLSGTKIAVRGHDKQKVGWFASKIRDIRRPNAFVKSLKGIFYEKEIPGFKVKAGKKDSKK